jgi:hypothetical protein
VSRHRSPRGRHSHPRPRTAGVAFPGASPRHASAESALRNGMTAAAVAGGALALVVPAVAVTTAGDDVAAADAAVLHLTAQERPAEPAPAARPAALAALPVAAPETGVVPVGLPVATDGLVMLSSIVPVAQPEEPEPPQVDAAELLKAVGLADVARKAEEERVAREAAAVCDAGLGGLGRVKPWVRDAALFLSCLFDEPTLIGVAPRARQSDHPSGLAIDFMTSRERGDRIAECALRNREALGITYVIWRQRVNYGDGWERMADRGGITANHFDHVHISFERRAPGADPSAALCG